MPVLLYIEPSEVVMIVADRRPLRKSSDLACRGEEEEKIRFLCIGLEVLHFEPTDVFVIIETE